MQASVDARTCVHACVRACVRTYVGTAAGGGFFFFPLERKKASPPISIVHSSFAFVCWARAESFVGVVGFVSTAPVNGARHGKGSL